MDPCLSSCRMFQSFARHSAGVMVKCTEPTTSPATHRGGKPKEMLRSGGSSNSAVAYLIDIHGGSAQQNRCVQYEASGCQHGGTRSIHIAYFYFFALLPGILVISREAGSNLIATASRVESPLLGLPGLFFCPGAAQLKIALPSRVIFLCFWGI